MRGLKIGVTFGRASEDVTQLLWASGINQNAVLLLLLLRRLPGVSEVALVDASFGPPPHPLGVWAGVPTLSPVEAAARLDIIIECGGRAPAPAMQRLRARGGKLVSYMAGNAVALNFEALSSGLGHGELASDAPFDACWITPQHWHMNRAHAVITRTPRTRIAPHLWEPVFFDELARRLGVDPFFKDRDPDTPWRIGVLEPNVNVLKTFHLPLLVCEEAFRASPQQIDRVLLYNTRHLTGVPHFDDLTTSMDLFKAGKLFAEDRHPTPLALAQHIDAVVVHQWENDLNYLYWDVLWTGHPLIHNSPSAQTVGYYYAPFDPADGGRVLTDALARHADPAHARAARAAGLAYLHRYGIDNPDVRAAHEALVEEVMA